MRAFIYLFVQNRGGQTAKAMAGHLSFAMRDSALEQFAHRRLVLVQNVHKPWSDLALPEGEAVNVFWGFPRERGRVGHKEEQGGAIRADPA